MVVFKQIIMQHFPVAGIRIEEQQQLVKKNGKAGKYRKQDDTLVEPACKLLDIMMSIYQHIHQRKEKREDQGILCGRQRAHEGHILDSVVDPPVKEERK